MRNFIAVIALLCGVATQFPEQPRDVESPAALSYTLVSEPQNPFERWTPEPLEIVPAPVADPIPNQLGSPETDALRQLADQLHEDAAEIRKRAEELKPALSSEYWEAGAACKCECLDEAAMRKIVSDEIVAALASNPRMAVSSPGNSNGSAGGTTSPFGSSVSFSSSSSPPFAPSGSAGGSVSTPNAYASSSTERPRLGQRVADRLRSPLRTSPTGKVTIHTFASGQYCGACETWLATVAPRLQADGVMVTQIPDVRSGAAPQIDVCKDNTSCVRIDGAASYEQIVGLLW